MALENNKNATDKSDGEKDFKFKSTPPLDFRSWYKSFQLQQHHNNTKKSSPQSPDDRGESSSDDDSSSPD